MNGVVVMVNAEQIRSISAGRNPERTGILVDMINGQSRYYREEFEDIHRMLLGHDYKLERPVVMVEPEKDYEVIEEIVDEKALKARKNYDALVPGKGTE